MNGMDVDGDTDGFFDDDFTDIAEDELRQLEQNAISFTQREQRPEGLNSSRTNLREAGHDLLAGSGASAGNNVSSRRPGRDQNVRSKLATERSLDPLLDENGLPLVVEEQVPVIAQRIPDETTQREQWRRKRFGPTSRNSIPHRQPAPHQSHNAYQPPAQFQAYPGIMSQVAPAQQDTFYSTTSALLEEEDLRIKVEELTASLAKANDELVARKGEIQIIRAKQAEGNKVHHRELDALRKLKQDDTEKHRRAIESLNTEKDKITADIQFLKQDLTDETRKVQALQRQLKERPLRDRPINVETTPKRNANSLRDGFDDQDLMVISPAKSGRRSNRGTPTANRKRKQPTGSETNVQPLVLRPSDSIPEEQASYVSEKLKTASVPIRLQRDKTTERHLRMIQQVLAFRPLGSQATLIEELTKFSFPSNISRPLSSYVLEAVAKLSGERLPGDLLQVFIDLWSRALKEKHSICISLLSEVVNYILDIDVFVVDIMIITNILPLLQSTAEIIASARFRLLVKKDWLDNSEKKKPELDKNVNSTRLLDLLYTIACLVSDDAELINHFWRSMSTDFVLMMLNACQPVEDVTIMLQLLATSILPATFGNICALEQQARMETYITDRVCYLLWETPKKLSGEVACTKSTICKLRLEAISLLTKLTMTSSPNAYDPSLARNHGTVFLANHPTAIARLVRSIYEEVAAMYLVTPTQSLHASLVNNAVRVLHFVLNSPAGREIDLQQKLAGTNGGAHKHRVVLTRLAFSEGLYIDRGITDETVRMATDLLEDSVTPDEANDLTAAFGGSIGRSGSTQD